MWKITAFSIISVNLDYILISCAQKPKYESYSADGFSSFCVPSTLPKCWQCKFDWFEKLINVRLCTDNFVLKYAKITKVECSSTGITCPNPKCNVVFVARNYSYMNAECDLKKPLTKFKVTKDKLHGWIFNIKLKFQFQIQFWKKLQNGGYRDIANLKDIDACWGIDNLDKFPMLSAQIDWFNQTFPEALDKCPKTVRAILTLNISRFFIFFSLKIAEPEISEHFIVNACRNTFTTLAFVSQWEL